MAHPRKHNRQGYSPTPSIPDLQIYNLDLDDDQRWTPSLHGIEMPDLALIMSILDLATGLSAVASS